MKHKYNYLSNIFLGMDEEGKYSHTLNWRNVLLKLRPPTNFKQDFKLLNEFLEQLSSLNEDKLKSILTPQRIEDYCADLKDIPMFTLDVLKSEDSLLKGVPEIINFCISDARNLYRESLWTLNEMSIYMVACYSIAALYEKHLKNWIDCFSDLNDVISIMDIEDGEDYDLHKYCNKAINKGYLQDLGNGEYKRTEKWSKAQLAYFLSKFLKENEPFKEKKYGEMFHEQRLGKTLYQLIENKNGKPRGYEIVDALFEE